MQLPLSDGRAVRMIQALLAAADPLERLERGSDAESYRPLAELVLAALRSSADARRIVMLLSEHAAGDPHRDALQLGPVVGFAEAAVDWWANAESRWASPVAVSA